MDSDGPEEANVQSYSPGGTNVPSWEGTMAHTIEPSVRCGDAALYVKLLGPLVIIIVAKY